MSEERKVEGISGEKADNDTKERHARTSGLSRMRLHRVCLGPGARLASSDLETQRVSVHNRSRLSNISQYGDSDGAHYRMKLTVDSCKIVKNLNAARNQCSFEHRSSIP